MTTATVTTSNTVSEPSILSANTYFWKPAQIADSRRRNEARNIGIVSEYLKTIGFAITAEYDNRVKADHPAGVSVVFDYKETCGSVYKSLSVARNGKNSNITAIRKIAAAL